MAEITSAGERVSIIGWSLGGIFGRELARAQPEVVRRVITLGSPFRLGDRDREQSYASGAYDALSGIHSDRADGPHPPEDARPPMPVRVTNVYSRTDGVALAQPDGTWQALSRAPCLATMVRVHPSPVAAATG